MQQEKTIRVFNPHTIISADKTIPVFGLELPVHVFLSLLHRNVHVPIETRQNLIMRRVQRVMHKEQHIEILIKCGHKCLPRGSQHRC